MIPSLRIDDRLIHGQIALVWSKAFGTNRIVVANDKAVTCLLYTSDAADD